MIQPKLSLFNFAAILLLIVPFSASVIAQTANVRTKPERSGRTAVQRCGSGVTLGLTRPSAAQGGLLELTLRSAAPLRDLNGKWGKNDLQFWADGRRVEHALLGVDLERAPGAYEVEISGTASNAEPLTCSASVDVTAGRFAIERLKVAPGFVELSPQDEARAAKESERLHEILAHVTPERLWRGPFRFPLAGKHTGHNFGRRRVLNGETRSPHTGLDIPAPAGTPIHAAQSGRVVLAENFFFSGNTVIVDHGLGVYTFYGHMKQIKVREGEQVRAGAILGLVGATGRATGPHLHWGLIVDGARVNPLGIIRLPLQ
jgi:murein DD-endopeptidase MepM/ murein hydrolase activator NlpD